MKKLVAVICVFMLSLFIGGCKNDKIDGKIPKFDNNIESNVKISSGDLQYECKIYHTPEGLSTITFISPQNLKDFTISRNCGKFEVTQGNLEANYMKDPLQKDTGIKYFMDILDILNGDERNFNLKSKQEGERTYKGFVESKECEIVLNSRGNIVRISMSNPECEVEFKG